MTRSSFTPRLRRRTSRYVTPILRRLPLAAAISAILAGASPAVHAAQPPPMPIPAPSRRSWSPRRSARRICRTCRSASRCSTTQARQLNVDGTGRLRQVSRRASPTSRAGSGRQRPAGHLAHLHARRDQRRQRQSLGLAAERRHLSRRAAGDHHRRHASTCISTTSSASRCSRARRAPCTARARRRAPCASSPTSRIPTKFEAGYDVEGNRVEHGGTGWQAEGFVNMPICLVRGHAPGRLGRARRGLSSTTSRAPMPTAASRTACAPSRPGQVRPPGRATASRSLSDAHGARCRLDQQRRSVAATTTTPSRPRAAAPRSSWTSATTGR